MQLILFVTLLVGHIAGLIVELRLHRRNFEVLRSAGAEFEGTNLMYALYGTYALSLPFMLIYSVVPGGEAPSSYATISGFLLVAFAQVLRRWAIVALGHRWCMTVVRYIGLKPLNTGPYRSSDFLSSQVPGSSGQWPGR